MKPLTRFWQMRAYHFLLICMRPIRANSVHFQANPENFPASAITTLFY
jgi:hypothetical protein